MSRYLCDTNCLVAALCAWHQHHERTLSEFDHRMADGQELILAAHSLAETYAVLTRLPPPNRLRGKDALALIEENWAGNPVVHLTGRDTWRALRDARQLGVVGGQTYDALIAASALKARATALVTWNVRNFAPFSERITVVTPR